MKILFLCVVYTSYISLPRNYAGNNFAGYVSTIQGFGVYEDAVGYVSDVKRYVSQNIMANGIVRQINLLRAYSHRIKLIHAMRILFNISC